MTEERLRRALARIETAAEQLAELGTAPPAKPISAPPDAGLTDTIEEQRKTLAERDRTIAKLRADLVDIAKLKDEEIDRLRAECERLAAAPSSSGDPSLQARYDRLESRTRAAIAALDTLIDQSESASHG